MSAPDLPTYPLTPEGVTEALTALDMGGSEDVATRLAELDVFGVRDNACACPIAAYLKKFVDGAAYVLVSGESAGVTGVFRENIGGFINSYDMTVTAAIPDAVSAFVEDFDQGIYPELIQEAAA